MSESLKQVRVRHYFVVYTNIITHEPLYPRIMHKPVSLELLDLDKTEGTLTFLNTRLLSPFRFVAYTSNLSLSIFHVLIFFNTK